MSRRMFFLVAKGISLLIYIQFILGGVDHRVKISLFKVGSEEVHVLVIEGQGFDGLNVLAAQRPVLLDVVVHFLYQILAESLDLELSDHKLLVFVLALPNGA